jgi:hypothetical protein
MVDIYLNEKQDLEDKQIEKRKERLRKLNLSEDRVESMANE